MPNAMMPRMPIAIVSAVVLTMAKGEERAFKIPHYMLRK